MIFENKTNVKKINIYEHINYMKKHYTPRNIFIKNCEIDEEYVDIIVEVDI